jgi:hypothetical protein
MIAAPLPYTPEVERATAGARERMRRVMPEVEWPVHAPYILPGRSDFSDTVCPVRPE